MLQTINFTIEGICPILFHNGQMADPLNKFSKQLKAVSGKRKKTDEDQLEMSRIEWHAGLYVNRDERLVIPSTVLESALVDGAKKSKLGKAFKSSVFVNQDAELLIPQKYKKASELWGDDRFVDRRPVKVGMAKVVRTRPIFREWSLNFDVMFDDEQVNESDVYMALANCGAKCGLCDYRPKFGRFEIK